MTSHSEIRILGFDPGRVVTGLAVVAVGGLRPALVDWLRVEAIKGETLPGFLGRVYHDTLHFLTTHRVGCVAMECIRMHRGKVGDIHANIRGAGKLAAVHALGESVLVEEIGQEWPRSLGIPTVTRSVKGARDSDARKAAHAAHFSKLFGVPELPSLDCMEAALVAYALSRKMEVEA